MTTKTELTPNLLESFASDIGDGSNEYVGLTDAQQEFLQRALNRLAEVLRESKPVAEIITGKNGEFNGQIFSDKQWVDLVNLPVGTKLYTHPQPVKKCEWKYSRLEEGWETQCKLHQYPSRLITFKFCPFCGGEIVEVK